MTFGVLRSVWSSRPGSTRSGEKARWKSTPARRPDSSSTGSETLARRAGVGRRLQDDQLAALQDVASDWRGATSAA